MRMARCSLAVVAGLTFAVAGCAAEPVDEPSGSTDSAVKLGDGAVRGAQAATASVSDTTLYMEADNKAVFYPNHKALFVYVCEVGADPALIARIKSVTGKGGAPYLVIKKQDGTFDTRRSELPTRETEVYFCKGSPLGGAAYKFHLWELDGDGGFLKDIDLSASLITGFSGKRAGCEGGVELDKGVGLDVKGFRVEDGALKQPQVTLRLSGGSKGAAKGRCFLRTSSKHFVMAGAVPVYFELQALFAVNIVVSRATTFHATIGTEGGTFESEGAVLSFTPQIELGVTFYGLIGGYVGVDLPITVTPKPPCSPEVDMSVTVKAGVQAGLIGFGDLPVTKALVFEAATTALGPFTLQPSKCK